MKFKYLDTTIDISAATLKYNELRQQFALIAKQAEQEFRIMYNQNENLDDVIKNVSDQGATVFQKVVTDKVMPLIVEMGIYTIDERGFLEEYYFARETNYSFDKVVLELSDAYFEIVLDKENLDAYRVARRQSRGRLVGGGFGVAGATKGILLAGAGNMISGGLHRVANGIGSMITSIQVERKKSKIFNNPDVIEKLAKEFYLSVFRLHYAFYDFLNFNFENIEMRCITEDDSQQSRAILLNIQNNRVEQEKVSTLLAEAIKLNPYNYDIYRELIKRYGDNENGIGELAELFGFNIFAYKENLLNQFFNELSLDNKQLAIQSRYDFKKYQEFLAVINTPLLSKIDNVINDFNLKEIELKTDFSDMKSLLKSLKQIDELGEFETDYKKELSLKINNKIEEIDIANRTFEGIVYQTEKDMRKAKSEKEELMKLFSTLDYSNEQQLLESFVKLQEKQEKEPYTTEAAVKYFEKKANELMQQVETLRTVEGVYYETYEEASIARKKAEKLNGLLKETNGDIEKIIELSKTELECDDLRLLEAYKEKLNKEINDKKYKCQSIIEHSQGIYGRVFDELKDLIGTIIVAIVISLIFSANWIKVICAICVIALIFNFIGEVFSEIKENVQSKSKVAEAKKQLKIIKKKHG